MDPPAQQPPLVASPRESDVLLGRGNQVNYREGNTNFRRLVQAQALNYTTSLNRHEKDKIARDIVANVEQWGGRFLRALNAGETSGWEIVKSETVLTKVKQALRDCAASMTKDPIRLGAWDSPSRKRRAVDPTTAREAFSSAFIASARPQPIDTSVSAPMHSQQFHPSLGNVPFQRSPAGHSNQQQMIELQSAQLQHLHQSLQIEHPRNYESFGGLHEQQRAFLESQLGSTVSSPTPRVPVVDTSLQDALLGIQMARNILGRQSVWQQQTSEQMGFGQQQPMGYSSQFLTQQQQLALLAQQQQQQLLSQQHQLLAQQQQQGQLLSYPSSFHLKPQGAMSVHGQAVSAAQESDSRREQRWSPQRTDDVIAEGAAVAYQQDTSFTDMAIPEPIPIAENMLITAPSFDLTTGRIGSQTTLSTTETPFHRTTNTTPLETRLVGEQTATDRITREESKQAGERKAPPDEDPKA